MSIDHLVVELRGLVQQYGGVDLDRRVGAALVPHIAYPGRRPRLPSALARHPRLPLPAAALLRAIGVHRLLDHAPHLVSPRLEAAHYHAVLTLEPAAQERVLKLALRRKWTVDRVRAEVAAIRTPRPGGRKPVPPEVRTLARVARLIATCEPLNFDFIVALDRERLAVQRGHAVTVLRWVTRLHDALAASKTPLDEVNAVSEGAKFRARNC